MSSANRVEVPPGSGGGSLDAGTGGRASRREDFGRETRASLILIGAQIATGLLTLAYSAYVGRTLGPEASADFFAALFLVFAFSTLVSPINGALTRFTSFFLARNAVARIRRIARSMSAKLVIAAFIIALLGVAFSGRLASLLGLEGAGPAAIAVSAGAAALLASVPRGLLRGAQRFDGLAMNLVAEAGMRLGLGVLLLAGAASATSALLAYPVALAFVVGLGYAQVALTPGWREPSDGGSAQEETDSSTAVPGSEDREVWRFVWPLVLFAIASAGFANADVLLVRGYLGNSGAAGPYGAAATLARLFVSLVIPFQILLLPVLTHLHAAGGAGLSRSFLRITGLFLLLAVPALALFGVRPALFLSLVYGSSFLGAAPILLPLSAAAVIGALAALAGQAFVSIGRFSFLAAYLGGFLLELVAVARWHDSTGQIVMVVLAVKTLTLLAVSLQLALALGGGPAGLAGRRTGITDRTAPAGPLVP